MSATGLKVWAERYVRPVRENGNCVEEVKLIAFDETWGTWSKDQWSESVEAWSDEVIALIASFAEEWPAKHHQVFIEAYSRSGDALGKYIYPVKGKNKEASAKLYGGETKAFADAMQTMVKNMRELLDASTQSAAIANSNAQSQAVQTNQLMQLLLQERLENGQLRERVTERAETDNLTNKFMDQLPGFLELGKLWVQSLAPTKGNMILKDAVEAVSQAVNNGE